MAISPFSAGLKLLHSLAIGTKNTVNFIFGNSKVRIKRFRYPRVIQGSGEPMGSYDYIKAFAQSELLKIMKLKKNNIKYTEIFKCENRGFNREFCLFVELNKFILIIYRGKIVFEEYLKNIKNCEIHYYNRCFIIKLIVKKGHSKGFRVNIKNSSFVCKFFDFYQNVKKKENNDNDEFENKNSAQINILDEIEEIDSIIDVDENKNKSEEIKEEEEEKTDNKDESIVINEIKTEQEKNIKNVNKKQRGIVINNFFISYNNLNQKIKLKNIHTDINTFVPNNTIINDESVYSSINGDSDLNYKDKKSFIEKKVYLNDSMNNSNIRYNSDEKFMPRLEFSESSSSFSKK